MVIVFSYLSTFNANRGTEKFFWFATQCPQNCFQNESLQLNQTKNPSLTIKIDY